LRHCDDDEKLVEAVRNAIRRKPQGHDFAIERRCPAVARTINTTGG
jgi:cyclic pyranopterin phosphate synthase